MTKRSLSFGAVIVGDEILLGKRQDSHFAFLRVALEQRGLSLSWLRVVGDDPVLLANTFRETRQSGAVVFSFGGIGATPDDLTRQAASEAFGLALRPHAEGLALLNAKFGEAMNARRQRLIEFPDGASLIPNPVNQVPGFSLFSGSQSSEKIASSRRQAAKPNMASDSETGIGHHFVPGFPAMAAPMVEWVLDNRYASHFCAKGDIERCIRVLGEPESELIPVIEAVSAVHPEVKISCLPDSRRNGIVELGVRGKSEPVIAAEEMLAAQLVEGGVRHRRLGA